MIWTDWLILGIIGLSGLLSLKRGFLREALSLLTWVAAFIVARLFSAQLGQVFSTQIGDPALSYLAAFGVLFILTLLAGGIFQWLASLIVRASGISATDRLLGVGFGLVRGVLVVVVLAALIRTTPVIDKVWWQSSALIPHFLLLEGWTRDMAATLGNLIWTASEAS